MTAEVMSIDVDAASAPVWVLTGYRILQERVRLDPLIATDCLSEATARAKAARASNASRADRVHTLMISRCALLGFASEIARALHLGAPAREVVVVYSVRRDRDGARDHEDQHEPARVAATVRPVCVMPSQASMPLLPTRPETYYLPAPVWLHLHGRN